MTIDRNDHERVSELLGPLVRGELDAATAQEVSEHLSGCAECSRERAGLEALAAEVEPLGDDERERVRVAVREATDRDEARMSRPARRRSLGARLGPALAAAALVALVVGGGALLFRSGGGASGLSQSAGQASRGGGGGGAAERPGPEAQQFRTLAKGSPTPAFDRSAGELSDDRLLRRGSRSRLFSSYAASFKATDARRLGDRFLDQLADKAGPEESVVRSCIDVVEGAQPYPILPTYGALGTLDGRQVLALGFTWSSSQQGPLDRFQFWVFPRGRCEPQLATYQSGLIDEGR